MNNAPRFYSGSPEDIVFLADKLLSGQLVAVPTETVYGLAANALDIEACSRIFSAKERPTNDPLIVHVAGLQMALTLADFPPQAVLLAEAFWPGPLTIVAPRLAIVPDIITSGLPTVAIRCPNHPLLLQLIEAANVPLAAPSANPFGYVSPTRAQHVADSLAGRVEHILDGGPCRLGIESTIVRVEPRETVEILRPGAVTRDMLSEALGIPLEQVIDRQKSTDPAIAPGNFPHHYSPKKPLRLFVPPELSQKDWETPGRAWVLWSPLAPHPPGNSADSVFYLTRSGDASEACNRIYDLLRQLDASDHSEIWVERPTGTDGLSAALRDRLARAAHSRPTR